MQRIQIRQCELAAAFSYDQESGRLLRIDGKSRKPTLGRIDKYGYRIVTFKGRKLAAHRIVWALVNGDCVPHSLDHINGNRDDNHIANLRPATATTNNQNRRGPSRKSTTGFLGVSQITSRRLNKKFVAAIKVDGAKKYIGAFESAAEAYAAYVAAKRTLHQGCTI